MRSHSRAFFAVAVLFALLSLAPLAQAAPKGVIGTFGEPGTEGGQFGSPAGVAVNQTSGDVYVADAPNQRIAQFDEDGNFIRAWGKDIVVDGGPGNVSTPPTLTNEQQVLNISGEFNFDCFCNLPITGGTFTVSFEAQTTAPIPYDATAAQVQSALESLPNIDTVIVTGSTPSWTVEFADALAGIDVPQMTIDPSALEPSGSNGSAFTQREGSTNPTGPTEICTDASTCRAGKTGNAEGELSFGSSPQLAIDQTDGSIYVADTNNHRIQKFSSTGVFIDEFGTNGSGQGEFNSPKGVAVDPASSDLYVADTDNNRVQRFESDGTFVDEIPGLGGSGDGEILSPNRVAVDSTGRLYLLDSGNARVQRFDNAGAFEQVFAPGSYTSPVDLVVDPATDNVLIAGSNADSSITGILEFDPSGNLLDIHAANAGLSPGGLSVRSSSERIYVSDSPNARVAILDFVTPPTLTIEAATDVTADSATLHGKVNPEGPPNASYRFEYSENGTTWIAIPQNEVPLGQGTSDIAVAQSLSGLDPNTQYKVRLRSQKDFNAASSTSPEVTFTTDPVLPIVKALPAGAVSESSAWLGAKVDPRKADTTFYVQYTSEDDPGFAKAISVPSSENAPVGSGKGFVLATRLIEGLEPETTYLFRVVASSPGGTTTGASGSFTTLAEAPPVQGLPDGRVWEKVSPAEKAGAHISPLGNSGLNLPTGILTSKSQAATDGDSVAFASEGKFDGDSGPALSQYLAKRGPTGWVTEGINSWLKPAGLLASANPFAWFSEDLSQAALKTGAALNPGDPEELGFYNLYLRDNETKTYRLISDAEASLRGRIINVLGISADGSTAFFVVIANPGSGEGTLFESTPDGTVQPITLPDGSEVIGFGIGNGMNPLFSSGFNPVSADGSRAYFTPSQPGGAGAAPLYAREAGVTTLVSASERFGDVPTEPQPARFLGASKDGSVAFFISSATLTDESTAVGFNGECGLSFAVPSTTPRCAHMYRWDATAPEGERLTDLTAADPQGSQVYGMTGISEDGTSVYFVAEGDLTGAGNRNEEKLYLWREGEGIRLVADAADKGLWFEGLHESMEFRRARVTPDGRFLAFESEAQLTSYDTTSVGCRLKRDTGTGERPCNQIYLYDSATEELTCVSCGTFSNHSKGRSWFLSSTAGLAQWESDEYLRAASSNENFPANLSADGRRIVFDSKDALVPEDTNGLVDVYEWQDGRLHLLSSGTAATPSRMIDASEDLDDVFFVTEQRLVRSDADSLRDLYDARVGGIPEPDVTPPCVADECQGTPTPPPGFQTPSSASFKGAGNASNSKPRCAKGKVRRKGRCVRRKVRSAKSAQKTKRANANRRAGR